MTLMSYKLRGCGSSIKRKSLSHIISKGHFFVCFLHETKLEHIWEDMVQFIWGGKEVEWIGNGSQGRSCGLLIMWKTGTSILNFSFKGEGFIGINLLWKGKSIYVVNIYSSCTINNKKKLCSQLCVCKRKFPASGVFQEILMLFRKSLKVKV